jgi:hypothetical protein
MAGEFRAFRVYVDGLSKAGERDQQDTGQRQQPDQVALVGVCSIHGKAPKDS